MSVNCGIIGLPNVGKSSLFNALTSAGAAVANYPFCTVDPNVGIVAVGDERLDRLSEIYRPKKQTPASLEIVDIAGLVEGASRGEGLGNQFLSSIGEVTALIHVVRCFDDPDVVHVHGRVDPKHDIEIIETELILKDLDWVEKRLARIEKKAKSGDQEALLQKKQLTEIGHALSAGSPARSVMHVWKDNPIQDLFLLTAKPILYVANVSDNAVITGNAYTDYVCRHAKQTGSEFVMISGKIESEIAAFAPEDATLFLQELGLSESGLCRLARVAYRLLGQITFFTVGEDEVKAWTLTQGTTAVAAAGKIHSDIERGFIRAEVFRYDDLIQFGSAKALKEKGLLRLEGKEYRVQDGDCIYFRFNV